MPPTSPPPGGRPPKELFLKNLKHIDAVVAHCCWRAHFSPQEAEDFGQHVKLKLIENDYGVFRKFQEKSSLETYLTTTIKNLASDYRDHIWSKFRCSAEAERLGEVAKRLETLRVRDKHSSKEAYEILRVNEGVELTEAELADLEAKLPHRIPRQVVGEETLQFEPAREPRPDQRLLEKERETTRRRVYMGLGRVLDDLSTDDQLFVKMWIKFSIAEIARILKVEQKPLYRRMAKILKALRKALECQGVRREDIEEILGPLEADFQAKARKNSG
jgi:RNA polymerase sigma factor for flagellar operon FliA